MFVYFGRKARIAHLYPRPLHDTIIEPFAGSAGYAMHADYWQRDVILIERDPAVAELWRWLIDSSTTFDTIAGLPDYSEGDPIPLDRPLRTLVILAQKGRSGSDERNVVTEWQADSWPTMRARVAGNLYKVKHWQLVEGDYTEAPDIEATWFIDPPYQRVAYGYDGSREGVDFSYLGEWSRTRRGQVIACDEIDADWLPFTPLTAHKTIKNTYKTEAVWLSEPDPGRLF